MKWIKASERLPEGIEKMPLCIKYKDRPDCIIFLGGRWCWRDNSFELSNKFPIQESSWSAIEWLDESSQEMLFISDNMKSAYGCGWGDCLVFMDEQDDPDLMIKKFNEFMERTDHIKKYLKQQPLNQNQNENRNIY